MDSHTKRRAAALVALAAALVLGALAWSALRGGAGSGADSGAVSRAPAPEGGAPSAEPPPRAARQRESAAPAAAVEPVPEPAAPATAAALEPAEEEIEALRPVAQPRAIEVLVLDGREPARGARVIAHPDAAGAPLRVDLSIGPAGIETLTDARGLAVLPDVEPGRYSVRVHWPPYPVQDVVVEVKDPPWRRTLVVFGSGTLVGTVYDAAGRPASGQHVEVTSFINGPMGSRVRLATITDAAGEYVLDGLNAMLQGDAAVKPYRVRCVLPSGSSYGHTFELGPGETLRIDFGNSPTMTRWTGRLVDTRGDPVAEIMALVAVGSSGIESRLTHAEEGRFVAALPPDEYSVGAWLLGGKRTIARVSVGTEELRQDLVLPGARLLVDLEYVGTAVITDEPLRGIQAWLRADGGAQDEQHLLSGDGPSTRVMRGLPSGRYWLTTWRQPLVGQPVPVDVTEEDAVVRVRAQVTDL